MAASPGPVPTTWLSGQTPLTWASALSCHRHGCTGHSPAVPLPTIHHSCCGRIPLRSDHLPSSCLGATRQPSDACSAGGSAMCYLGWEALHRVPSSPLQFCPCDWGLPLCSGMSPLCPLDVPGLGQVLAPTRGVSLGPFSQPPLVGPCTLYLNWYLPSFARTFLNHHGAWGAGLENPGRSPVWGSCSDRLLPAPRVPPALHSQPPRLV